MSLSQSTTTLYSSTASSTSATTPQLIYVPNERLSSATELATTEPIQSTQLTSTTANTDDLSTTANTDSSNITSMPTLTTVSDGPPYSVYLISEIGSQEMSQDVTRTILESKTEQQTKYDHFNWKTVQPCNLWKCPLCTLKRRLEAAKEQTDDQQDKMVECSICAQEVPKKALMDCSYCGNYCCVLCRLHTVSARNPTGLHQALGRVTCCFCRRPYTRPDLVYLDLVYENHRTDIKFKLWAFDHVSPTSTVRASMGTSVDRSPPDLSLLAAEVLNESESTSSPSIHTSSHQTFMTANNDRIRNLNLSSRATPRRRNRSGRRSRSRSRALRRQRMIEFSDINRNPGLYHMTREDRSTSPNRPIESPSVMETENGLQQDQTEPNRNVDEPLTIDRTPSVYLFDIDTVINEN